MFCTNYNFFRCCCCYISVSVVISIAHAWIRFFVLNLNCVFQFIMVRFAQIPLCTKCNWTSMYTHSNGQLFYSLFLSLIQNIAIHFPGGGSVLNSKRNKIQSTVNQREKERMKKPYQVYSNDSVECFVVHM